MIKILLQLRAWVLWAPHSKGLYNPQQSHGQGVKDFREKGNKEKGQKESNHNKAFAKNRLVWHTAQMDGIHIS